MTDDTLLALENHATDDPSVLLTLNPTTGDDAGMFEPEADHVSLPAVADKTAFLPVSDALLLLDLLDGDVVERCGFEGHSPSFALASGISLLSMSRDSSHSKLRHIECERFHQPLSSFLTSLFHPRSVIWPRVPFPPTRDSDSLIVGGTLRERQRPFYLPPQGAGHLLTTAPREINEIRPRLESER